MNVFYHPWIITLSQIVPPTFHPWDDADQAATPPAPPQKPLDFTDLQQGMRNWRASAEPDNSARNWLLMAVAAVALLVLFVQLHQRWQNRKKGAVDSEFALFRELTRGIPLPFGSTILLWWMARSAHVNLPALLISPGLFRGALKQWSQAPTLSMLRRMAEPRLERVERMLFA